MKKFFKTCLCFVIIACATLTFAGCSTKEVEENTKTAIEATTSIIPVEYSKETAQGILMAAYQKLLSAEKVNMKGVIKGIENGVYSEYKQDETVVYKNNSRYFYVDAGDDDKFVVGKYKDKDYCLDVKNKKAEWYVASSSTDIPSGVNYDVISSFVTVFGEVVSGRYFNGVTYINLEFADPSMAWVSGYAEIKIVDGNIVEMSTTDTENGEVDIRYGSYTFTYGDSVDVSVIPDTIPTDYADTKYTAVTPVP